jgi:MgtC family
MPIIRGYGRFTATSFTIWTQECSRRSNTSSAQCTRHLERQPSDDLIHLLVAFILALPIGWNRARAERGAGLRSLPLVAMAGCGLVQTAILVLRPDARSQANILQGVVIGVGFIGSGALIRQGDITTGNATAANVWVVGTWARRSAIVTMTLA